MTVLITLTTAGSDSGPFNLYSNLDGYVTAFETGVNKASLLAGYSSALVPDSTTIVRVKSTGVCTNYIDITLETTTTTTTAAPTTTTTTAPPTTTTTTAAPTTTTTTTVPLVNLAYTFNWTGSVTDTVFVLTYTYNSVTTTVVNDETHTGFPSGNVSIPQGASVYCNVYGGSTGNIVSSSATATINSGGTIVAQDSLSALGSANVTITFNMPSTPTVFNGTTGT